MEVLRGAAPSPGEDREATAALATRVRETGRPAVRVWFPPGHVAFGPRDRRSPGYDRARRVAADRDYPPVERDTGGRAVAFTGDVLACCRVEPANPRDPAVDARYDRLLADLESACRRLGVETERGEPPGSFCPGTQSLRAGGKVAGLAQRISRGVATVAAVVVVSDATAVAGVLAPVYDALGADFDPGSVGSLRAAGCSADDRTVRATVESALVGDAEPAVRRVRDT